MVVIFRSRSASPEPDPVLYMSGGPGNSTVDGRRSGKGLPFLEDRDYILLEQRGARHAYSHSASVGSLNTIAVVPAFRRDRKLLTW